MKYVLFWMLFIPVAILNGILREKLLTPYLSLLLSHQLSTLIFIVLFGIMAGLFFLKWPLTSTNQMILVGLLWLCFTICFEFLFGHYIIGNSWHALLDDYNIIEGRVWLLALLWIFSAPYVLNRFLGKH